MKTDREKLIRMLLDFHVTWNTAKLADYLISKGVTIPIKCGECKHWENGDCYRIELTKPNDFCSYGERRKE